ncbi:MAG: hypothetical protein ACPLTR_08485 [Thermacetogeniaceae bacterium]
MQVVKFFRKAARSVYEFLLTLFCWGLAVAPAWADGTAGIAEKSAEDVASTLVNVLKEVIMPLGSFIIFASIAWTAFKIITTANKPSERAEAMASIPYILGGGLVLGGVMLISGFIVGLMRKVGGGQ